VIDSKNLLKSQISPLQGAQNSDGSVKNKNKRARKRVKFREPENYPNQKNFFGKNFSKNSLPDGREILLLLQKFFSLENFQNLQKNSAGLPGKKQKKKTTNQNCS